MKILAHVLLLILNMYFAAGGFSLISGQSFNSITRGNARKTRLFRGPEIENRPEMG